MKLHASKCATLINFPSSKLATLSKYEKMKLDTNSIQVLQGQTLFWEIGGRECWNDHKSLLFSAKHSFCKFEHQ